MKDKFILYLLCISHEAGI